MGLSTVIRHIATSYDGPVIAAAEFEHRLHIFDLETGQKVATFDSIMDFGGRRLAISPDGQQCAAGAYHAHGLAMYDAGSGELLWQRKDLKKVQQLQFSKQDPVLLACFERGPAHVLDLSSGATLRTMRGISRIEESPFGRFRIVCRSGRYEILDDERHVRIGQRGPGDFYEATFTPSSVVLCEFELTGKPMEELPSIREQLHGAACFSLEDGRSLWRHMFPTGINVQRFGFAESVGEIVSVTWPYVRGGDKNLVCFDKDTGEIRREFGLLKGPLSETEFARRGNLLITSAGEVINVAERKVAQRLDFPPQPAS